VRLVTCRPDSTLRELLAAMVVNRVHRVFVVEAAGGAGSDAVRPLGVVTPTDVLRLVAGEGGVPREVQVKCMS
jgi:CBS domain-containing protein